MDPARLARSWHPRLPGAAMLALERASRGLGDSEATATATAAATDEAPAAAMGSALDRGLRARGERARAALRDVKRALGDASTVSPAGTRAGSADGRDAVAAGRDALAAARDALAAARDALAAARDLAAPLADPTLHAWIEIFESEIACAAGDVRGAAAHSCAAEDIAQRAGDDATYLAIWWLRAVRALRRGDGGVGEWMTRWMRVWLGRVAPRALTRLDCVAAAFALDDERADDAIEIGARVVAAAPGTFEAALAGSIVTQAFLGLDRMTDAARIATSSIERCPGLPPALAARLYHEAATALEATGAADVAARCNALARTLDPDVDRPTSRTDIAAVGIEIRLL